MIEPIFAFDTALSYWSNPNMPTPSQGIPAQAATEAFESMSTPMRTAQLDQLLRYPIMNNFSRPLEILVPVQEARRKTRRAHYSLWQSNLPDDAVLKVDSRLFRVGDQLCAPFVSSPAFCFTQMARRLPFAELVELGYELCGDYAVSPCSPKGLLPRAARTTPEELVAFTGSIKGARSIRLARKAAQLVLPNSRSPKESQLAMLATFPESLGGFGLPKPLLNHEIHVEGDAAHILMSSVCIPDLYWADYGIVMEYDSSDFHNSAAASEHDARKRTVYRLLGIDVITVTSGQIVDFVSADAIMADLAARITKHKPNSVGPELHNKRRALHHSLFKAPRRKRLLSPAHMRDFSA